MTKQEATRPLVPYRMPEGDISTLRRMYTADEYKGIKNCRALLEEAFTRYKQTNKHAEEIELPDTFKEVLDTEKGNREGDKTANTYPTKFYMGVIMAANLILEDTYSAEATLQGIDAGDFTIKTASGHTPRILRAVSYQPNEETTDIKKNVFLTKLNAELFARPEKFMDEWAAAAQDDAEREQIANIRKTLSDASFRDIVNIIAEEMEADPAQLMNPEQRTDEQRERLIKQIREEIAKAERELAASLYMSVLGVIRAKGRTGKKISAQIAKHIEHYAAAYYFAKHPEKDYRQPGNLTADEEAELLDVHNKILYRVERSSPGKPLLDIIKKFIEAENPEASEQEEIIKAITPKKQVKVTSTIMTYLAGMNGKKPINAGGKDLVVLPKKGKQKEISVYVMASYAPDKKNVFNLTENEWNVSDALCSIWEQAQADGDVAAFDINTLCRAAGGGSVATPKQEKEFRDIFYKLTHLDTNIDATEELQYRGLIGKDEAFHIKDMFVSLQELTLTTKRGRRKAGEENTTKSISKWIIKSEPPILTYSKMTRQIITVPSKVLQIKKIGKDGRTTSQAETMGSDRQAMLSYLVRRVAIIKRDYDAAKNSYGKYLERRKHNPTIKEETLDSYRHQSDTILFSTLFKETGTETSDRKQTMLNRNFCFDVLTNWTEQKFIKGFSKKQEGRSISGIVIEH